MSDWFVHEPWLAWGVGLLIGFPLLAILFGEMLYRIESRRSPSWHSLAMSLYFLLPSLVVLLLFTRVLELEENNTWVRVAATLFWISLIHLGLSAFNLVWSAQGKGTEWHRRIPSLVLNIVRLFVVLLGIAFVMSSIWGIDLGKMLAALGVGSIVLGLALQDTLGGLFAGITLISARQFKVGDWLQTDEVTGQVVMINWYSVTLRTLENDLLVIPNSVLAKGTFRNYSQPSPVHMERIVVQFWEEHPPNRVRTALEEAARATPGILQDPPPRILLRELADDAGAYEAQLFFDDYGEIDRIRDAYLTRAWYAAKRHNLVFPYEDHQLFHFAGSEMKRGNDELVPLAELVHRLEALEVFDLGPEALAELVRDARVLRFGVGETVLRAGEENTRLLVLLSGRVRSYVKDRDGDEREMGVTEAGELLGLVSTLRRIPSPLGIEALEDVQVAELSPRSMERVLRSNPPFAQSLEEAIEQRLEAIEAILQRGGGVVRKL